MTNQFVRNLCLRWIGGGERQTNKRWEYRALEIAVGGSRIHHDLSNCFCNFLRQPTLPGIRPNMAEIDHEDPFPTHQLQQHNITTITVSITSFCVAGIQNLHSARLVYFLSCVGKDHWIDKHSEWCWKPQLVVWDSIYNTVQTQELEILGHIGS